MALLDKRVCVVMPARVVDQIDEIADEERRSRAWIIRVAVEKLLAERQEPADEAA